MIDLFSTDEAERIEQAVFEAEARTSAEIVPCVIDAAGRHDVALWRSAVVFALGALMVALLVVRFYIGWGLAWLHTPWGTPLVMLAAGVGGALLTAAAPPVKRFFAGGRYLDRQVHQRAMQAFVEEEVFRTSQRTGILIFISLLEHRIEVLGDAGINERVAPDDWAEVVLRIQQGIREDRLAEGLIEAIRMCGDLLEKSGLAVTVDDVDELSNRVRLVRSER